MTASLRALAAALLIAFAGAGAVPALAAGSSDGSSDTSASGAASSGTYAQAKALVDAGNYAEARVMLKDITAAEPANADAWNLLGFSSRKSGDLKAASKAYTKALKLNPQHLGALEYQGEMYIEMGKLDKAQANLDALKAACGSCEEMQDLQQALKAAGA